VWSKKVFERAWVPKVHLFGLAAVLVANNWGQRGNKVSLSGAIRGAVKSFIN
jgi:hypothetical protein